MYFFWGAKLASLRKVKERKVKHDKQTGGETNERKSQTDGGVRKANTAETEKNQSETAGRLSG